MFSKKISLIFSYRNSELTKDQFTVTFIIASASDYQCTAIHVCTIQTDHELGKYYIAKNILARETGSDLLLNVLVILLFVVFKIVL